MSETTPSTQANGSRESAPADRAAALLQGALDKYRQNVTDDVDRAQVRYGFTLYHSLKPEEKVEHLQRLGFEPQDEIDHYNLGCAAALQENFDLAIDHFQKAVAAAPKMVQAHHNLALSLERAGRANEAKGSWAKVVELTEQTDERAAVEAHVATLG